MLWMIFWCPEEDVELYIFPFSYSYLFLFKNTKAVPKVVPIYASSQSDDLWLAPQTGHWWFLQRRSASSPNYGFVATRRRSGFGNMECSIRVLFAFGSKWPAHSRRSSSSTIASSVSARCFTATAFFPTYAIASSRNIDTTVAWVFSIP